MRPIYALSGGLLHRYPATEQCNLDDSNKEQLLTRPQMAMARRAGRIERPCLHCYPGTSTVEAVEVATVEESIEALAQPDDAADQDTVPALVEKERRRMIREEEKRFKHADEPTPDTDPAK